MNRAYKQGFSVLFTRCLGKIETFNVFSYCFVDHQQLGFRQIIDEPCRIPIRVQTSKTNIAMDIPAGEVEFRANYSLFGLGGLALASPAATVGLPGFAGVETVTNAMDAQLRKLDSYCK